MKKLIILVLFILQNLVIFASIDPNKVYIVVNKDFDGSKELGLHYALKRNIPIGNIIELSTKETSKISRKKYYQEIENPLIEQLRLKNALKLQKIKQDQDGRDEYIFLSSDVDFIVLCMGIPWGINKSPLKDGEKAMTNMTTDAAALDSELSAKFIFNNKLRGFVKNPLYASNNPNAHKTYGILRVSRLDAPDINTAFALVNDAIDTEEIGLMGRLYIDKSQFAKEGDVWLDKANQSLTKLGYDLSIDNEKALMGFNDRFDGLALYLGWYSSKPVSYFTLEDFRTAKGAICVHIFSFSASDLRNSKTAWLANMLSHGTTFTLGNVFEPFLGLTHHLDKFASAISMGMSMGQATYYSNPALSWQNLSIGDPLYQPLRKSLDEQIAIIDSGNVNEYSQYAIINKINLTKDKNLAIDFGDKYIGKIQDEALIWKLLNLAVELNDTSKEQEYQKLLKPADFLKNESLWGLGFEYAKYMNKVGQKNNAILFYENLAELLAIKNISDKILYKAIYDDVKLLKYSPQKNTALEKICESQKK